MQTSTYDAANRLTSRQQGGSGQTPLHIDFTCTARDQIATALRYSDLAGTTKVEKAQGVGSRFLTNEIPKEHLP